MSKKDVSIIIVNYNTKELLDDCLNSVYVQTHSVNFEIIVVDNASSDGSREYITSRHKNVIWIQSDENLGFGRANNLGACQAKGDYLFLLNSDTILLNDAISIFHRYMLENDRDDCKIGVIGCQLIDKNGKPNTAGGNFIKPFHNRVITPSNGFQHTCKIDYVMGADMFLSSELFRCVGGFDEAFFMYCEEVDLQKRIHSCKRTNYIIEGPRIIHLEGASFKEKGLSFRKYMMWQNSRNLYAKKHFGFTSMVLWKLEMMLLNPRIILREHWTVNEKMKAIVFCLSGKVTD